MVGPRSFSLALLVLALLPASAAANPANQIIVKRDAGLSAAEAADIRADADVRLVERLPLPRTEVVAAAPGDVTDALRDLNADPDVVYAERNRPIRAFDDPDFDQLWGLENLGVAPFFIGAVVDADTDTPDAWAESTGSGETIAVVDSGVDLDHPDLAGQLTGGFDYVDRIGPPEDGDGHGTHVTGTIAAVRDNSVGVVGIAPDAQVEPLRVLNDSGQGLVDDAVEAFNDAGDDPDIAIVNASLGGEGAVQTEHDAIEDNPHVLYVVAAGNDGANNDSPALANYPCAYDLPNVLCVAASRFDDTPSEFSNYGATTVDLFAPGEAILSTWLNGGYVFNDGTSMATPHVAGAAALVREANPALTPTQVKAVLLQSGDYKPAFAGLTVTGKRLNARQAVTLAQAGPAPDGDGDGFRDSLDACPAAASSDMSNGCPDRDDDGYTDAADNCPTVNNTQTDTDGDGLGDACDATPGGGGGGGGGGTTTPPPTTTPPADADGDGRYDISDACPNLSAATTDGCPVAQVSSVSARVKKRTARLTIKTTRPASMKVTIERKRGGRWVRVKRTTVITSGNRAIVSLSRLKRGSHRVRISISSSSGRGTPVTKGFRVR